MKKILVPKDYRLLVSKVSQELSDMELFFKRRTTEGSWRIGRYIDEHILEHKDRADYGKTVIINLAKDVGRDPSLLNRTLKFYRAYPILAAPPELSWEHYRSLITVKDEGERKKLEQKAISKDWNTRKLRDYLNTKRELTVDDNKPVPQLTFTRGQLNTYRIVAANKTFIEKSPLVLDLGFREQYLFPKNSRPKENEIVELVWEKGEFVGVKKSDAASNELFTYQAKVEKVVDGDTLLVSFEFNLEVSISQKLRLRGIDCPEMDTEEGKKAKRFVESRLKGCEFIIVKTYKDRTDNWDRYLADIFYLEGTVDPSIVAKEGKYLNQELLDNRLAVIWKS